ncbi:hypothetical protein KY289_031014 [Solanum tuberosum]|nr:hypothetical protein KY289_031014 [Solanum tuberosum]
MTNRYEECGTRLKIIHATSQKGSELLFFITTSSISTVAIVVTPPILSFLLVTAAAIMSIGNFDNSFTNNWLSCLCCHMAAGIFKPDR